MGAFHDDLGKVAELESCKNQQKGTRSVLADEQPISRKSLKRFQE